MTHGFTSGKLLAQQALIERTGVGEFVEYNDGTDTFKLFSSDGSPEGVIAADKGSQAADITNGALYIKTTDTANTGWSLVSAGATGGWTLLSTTSPTSGQTVTISIDTSYDEIYIDAKNLVPSAAGTLAFNLYSDGGTTPSATGGTRFVPAGVNYQAFPQNLYDNNSAQVSVTVKINNFSQYTRSYEAYAFGNSGGTRFGFVTGNVLDASPINAIKWDWDSTKTFVSGDVQIWGK